MICYLNNLLLQEVKELNLTKNPAFASGSRNGDGYDDHQNSPYICPVLGLEMNGRFKFCFYWSCGCVFSEKALKGLKPTICHKVRFLCIIDSFAVVSAIQIPYKLAKNPSKELELV